MKKILVTGSAGFVGTNLCNALKEKGYLVYRYDRESSEDDLNKFCKEADFVFNLAGVMRPIASDEYYAVNSDLTKLICDKLLKNNNKAPVVLTSSIHAERGDDYGKSKLLAEQTVKQHAAINKSKSYIFRLTNLFGRYAKPNYSSVVATWCYNANNNLPLEVMDKNFELGLCFVDDIVKQFLDLIENESPDIYHACHLIKKITLGDLKLLITDIKKAVDDKRSYKAQTDFEQKMYETYLTYRGYNG